MRLILQAIANAIFVLLVFLAFQSNAQIASLDGVEFQEVKTNFEINPTFSVIKFDVLNLIKCADMPIAQFESLLSSNGYDLMDNQYSSGDYAAGNTEWGYQIVTKEPGAVTIAYTDTWKVQTRQVFNKLLDELEKYYLERDGDYFIYGFKKNEKSYLFKANKEDLILFVQSKF